MSIGERMLRIIERVGILLATTFDSSQSETMNINFSYSYIGMCVVILHAYTSLTSIFIQASIIYSKPYNNNAFCTMVRTCTEKAKGEIISGASI